MATPPPGAAAGAGAGAAAPLVLEPELRALHEQYLAAGVPGWGTAYQYASVSESQPERIISFLRSRAEEQREEQRENELQHQREVLRQRHHMAMQQEAQQIALRQHQDPQQQQQQRLAVGPPGAAAGGQHHPQLYASARAAQNILHQQHQHQHQANLAAAARARVEATAAAAAAGGGGVDVVGHGAASSSWFQQQEQQRLHGLPRVGGRSGVDWSGAISQQLPTPNALLTIETSPACTKESSRLTGMSPKFIALYSTQEHKSGASPIVVPHRIVFRNNLSQTTWQRRKNFKPLKKIPQLASIDTVPAYISKPTNFQDIDGWADDLARVDPFIGVQPPQVEEARLNTFFNPDGTTEPGVSLRSFVVFLHDTVQELDCKKGALRKFLLQLKKKAPKDAFVVVEAHDVFGDAEMVTWTAWRAKHVPAGGLPAPPPTAQETREAREAVQQLMTSLDAAESRAGAIEAACQVFLETDFGKKVKKELHEDGILNIPYGVSEDDALEMASVVCESTKDLMLSDKPHRERKMIKGQTRYMLEARLMGRETDTVFKQTAKAMAEVLHAVVDGASPGVISHMRSALACAENTEELMWHRDEYADLVTSRTDPSRNGKRKRPEPLPFSAVTAFQPNTVLHVVKGSHHRGGVKDFRQGVPCAHGIPTGWSAVFYSILVHHGMGTEDVVNVRGHMYLTVVGCTLPSFGKVETTIQGPE